MNKKIFYFVGWDFRDVQKPESILYSSIDKDEALKILEHPIYAGMKLFLCEITEVPNGKEMV